MLFNHECGNTHQTRACPGHPTDDNMPACCSTTNVAKRTEQRRAPTIQRMTPCLALFSDRCDHTPSTTACNNHPTDDHMPVCWSATDAATSTEPRHASARTLASEGAIPTTSPQAEHWPRKDTPAAKRCLQDTGTTPSTCAFQPPLLTWPNTCHQKTPCTRALANIRL